jgi:hypothetical protein
MISLSFVFIQVAEASEQINTAARDKILHRENEAVRGDDVDKIVDDFFTIEGNGQNDWFDLKNAIQGPYGSADFK